jgi:threonine dehydratase
LKRITLFPEHYYEQVLVTPYVRYQGPLAEQSELWLKDETRQVGKSFKFRGTYHRLLEEPVGSTVVTASTGNHGMGVALAARLREQQVLVFVPAHISTVKAQALEELGATVEKVKGGYDECVQKALHFSAEHGAPYISSLDDPSVVHGHSSLFREIRRQEEGQLDALYLPVGGGGLLAGCLEGYEGTEMPIVGVELECVPSMKIALETGERVLLPPARSLAEGMLVRQAGVLPLERARAYADFSVELASEEELEHALALLWRYNHIRAEGAGAAAVAAALRRVQTTQGQRIAAVISGGNIDEETFQTVIKKWSNV